MKNNSNFEYDLLVGNVQEDKLAWILEGKKIEVKYDLRSSATGNAFIEYESRGKKSGIARTGADYYCIWLSDDHFVMMATERLKQLARIHFNKGKVLGGDSDTSKGVLIPLNELIRG